MNWLKKIIKEIRANEGRPAPITALDVVRLLQHIPVGLFAMWLISVNPWGGIVFAGVFVVYEFLEDWRIKDRSYKDVLGYLIGLGIMGTVLEVWLR